MMSTAFSYDAVGRIEQTSTSYLSGGVVEDPSYDGAGNIISSVVTTAGKTMNYAYTYDHSFRQIQTTLDGNVLRLMEYDEKDYPKKKQLQETILPDGSTGWLQTIDYRYDTAGRLTSINNGGSINEELSCKGLACDFIIFRHPLGTVEGRRPGYSAPVTRIRVGSIVIDGATLTLNGPYLLAHRGRSDDTERFRLDIIQWLEDNEHDYEEVSVGLEPINGEFFLTISITGTGIRFDHLNVLESGRDMMDIDNPNSPNTIPFTSTNCCQEGNNPQEGNDLFAFDVSYQGSLVPSVNWQVLGGGKNSYTMTYDGLARIKTATHEEIHTLEDGSSQTFNGHYDMQVTAYDQIGNILGLKRKGMTGLDANGLPQFGQIDDLTYNYSGGLLAGVTENADIEKGFKGNTTGFGYDANGNMLSDGEKGINNIEYNVLNLPNVIHFSDGRRIEFTYDAAGVKHRKQVFDETGTLILKIDYAGATEFRNDTLEAVYFEEGRFTPKDDAEYWSGWQAEYQYTDHLGNTRLTYADLDEDGILTECEILQQNHYYPFGMNMEGAWSEQLQGNKLRYQYNGKELNEDFGLDLNDYGARWYDAAIGRWTSVDPLAESPANIGTSVYTYVWNSPLAHIDPDGRHGEGVTNEYVIDKNTGKSVQVGNKGGDEKDYISTGTINEDGSYTVDEGSTKEVDVEHYEGKFTGGSASEVRRPGFKGTFYNATGFLEPVDDPITGGEVAVVAGVKMLFKNAFKFFVKLGGKSAAKGLGNLTKSQLKAIASLEKQIAAHTQKLKAYKANPMKFDNKGFLKNAPNDVVKRKIIQGRVNHLQQEINTFQNNIKKILNGK